MSPLPVPVDIAPTPVAEIGHNSRISKVAQEIAEIRASFIAANLHEGVKHKERVWHAALISEMTDADFRILCGYLAFGNSNVDNITVSQKSVARLIGRSERTIRRRTEDLEKEGWFTSKRNGRKAAIRVAKISPETIKAIYREIADRTNLTCRDTVISFPKLGPDASDRPSLASHPTGQTCLDRTKLAALPQFDRTTSALRPDKLGQQENLKIEPSNNNNIITTRARTREEGCEDMDLQPDENDKAMFFSVMNTFSRDSKALIFVPIMPRASSDANLLSRFNGWTKVYPANIVLRCLRNVLADMQLRSHDADRTKKCLPTLSGFSGYLTACMDSALVKASSEQDAQKNRPEQVVYPQSQQPQPPQRHWRDDEPEWAREKRENRKRWFEAIEAMPKGDDS